MNTSDFQQKALGLINLINAAITNVRLYPPGSALIRNSVQRMGQSVTEMVQEIDVVEYAEVEKKLLIQGEALSDRDQKKPQVVSFLRMLAEHGLRSISIKKGLREGELAAFVEIMGTAGEEVKAGGGIKQAFQDRQIAHIAIDEQIYVKLDAERTLAAEMNLSDRDIAAALVGQQEVDSGEMEKIREMFKDATMVARIFKEGVRQILKDPGDDAPVPDAIGSLITAFTDMAGPAAGANAKEILNTLLEMEDAVLLSVFTRNIDEVFGESVFAEFMESLEKGRLNGVKARFRHLQEMVSENDAYAPSQGAAIDHVLEIIENLPEKKPQAPLAEKSLKTPSETSPPSPAVDRETRIKRLTGVLSRLLKGDADALTGFTDVDGLAAVVAQMADKGKQFTVDAVIEKLGAGLSSENKKIRDMAAALLGKIEARLDDDTHLDRKVELSRKLVQYLKNESEISDVYEKIARQLQQAAQQMILKEKFDAAKEILDVFQGIYTGSLEKNDAITALTENMLQNISTDEILDILLKDGATDDITHQKKDIYSLIIMGATTVERLLDRLYETHNRAERSRIIQVVTKIGKPAVASVEERLRQGGPWFYARNLVLLMGRIGDRSHLKLLESTFENEDLRVQREAVFAIQAIDPAATGEILLRNLYTVGPENMGLLISVIGMLKYDKAVPKFLEMLELGFSAVTKKEKNALMVKICEALGKIGHPDAIRGLRNLIRSKGFLSFMGVDLEVREAAEAAIKAIKKKG